MGGGGGTLGFPLPFFPLNFPPFPEKYLTQCVVNDVSTDIKDSSVILMILLICHFNDITFTVLFSLKN